MDQNLSTDPAISPIRAYSFLLKMGIIRPKIKTRSSHDLTIIDSHG